MDHVGVAFTPKGEVKIMSRCIQIKRSSIKRPNRPSDIDTRTPSGKPLPY
jgi:hypothetical protein